jgi:hypothetical protein
MNTLILLQISIILHLVGLTLMAGTTVAEYITFNTFSKLFDKNRERSLSLLELLKKLSGLLGIGAALLILSGIGLLIITNGVFIHQLWFRIKLLLIGILILNGFLVGSRQESKLKTGINETGEHGNEQITKAMRNLRIFYRVQMGIFFIIIVLAVFKFS